MEAKFFYDSFFICAVILLLISVLVFQNKGTIGASLAFLFLSSLFFGLFMIHLDSFLNIWDERFHALVAKNISNSPFRPVLITEPLFGYSKSTWSYCNIWLHKQPLFLWQIALSCDLFGQNEIGIRIPSLLMHSISLYFIYRVGEISFDKNVGFYSALFFTISYFPLEYLTGFYSTDHNDTAFMFYSFGSIWALFEFYRSKEKRFLIIIGLMAGAAIMCKWLTGLLVYGVWAAILVYDFKRFSNIKNFANMIYSLCISLVVFLPWQIFAYTKYPEEYRNAMNFNYRHIIEPLESHSGNYLFYYNALFEQFGEGLLIPSFVLLSFLFMIYHLQDKHHKLIFLVTSLLIFSFFTIVKTKMLGYVLVCFPLFILGISFVFNSLLTKALAFFRSKFLVSAITLLCTLTLSYLLFNSHKIMKHHSCYEKGRCASREILEEEKERYISIKKKYGSNKCLIFNCSKPVSSHIAAIYYTDFPSFNYVLPPNEIKKAKNLNYQLIAIDWGDLPDWIAKDSTIIKVPARP